MSTPTLFLVWRDDAADALARLRAALGLNGVMHALAFTRAALGPGSPFAGDGAGPALTLELAFADEAAFAAGVDALEAALVPAFEAQAMRGRRFATPEPAFQLEPGQAPCTLLVEYPGACDDLTGWLDHYDAHHPAIMARFPAIRDIATFRPAPDLPLPSGWRRANAMQRNKVVFDGLEALAAALASPTMREMRADFAGFPPYTGAPTHFPTDTLDLRP